MRLLVLFVVILLVLWTAVSGSTDSQRPPRPHPPSANFRHYNVRGFNSQCSNCRGHAHLPHTGRPGVQQQGSSSWSSASSSSSGGRGGGTRSKSESGTINFGPFQATYSKSLGAAV